MEMFLKELEVVKRRNLASDCSEEISLIVYIASLTEDIIAPNDIEAASKVLYFAIANISENIYDSIENLLRENKQNPYVTVTSSSNDIYKVYVRNKRLFQLILLCCVRQSDIFFANKSVDQNTVSFLRFCIEQIIKYIFIEIPSSVPLLRTLLLILTKRIEVLTCSLSLAVLKCMDRVALSPVAGFKHYAKSISKIAITALSTDDKNQFLQIDALPMRGIDMCDIVRLFSEDYVKENKIKIVDKVLKLFLNNVESKDGGFLYESVLFYSFKEWKVEIWPLFESKLQHVEYEGEFFQSLLKYWIPLNVSAYKHEFYVFLKTERIDDRVKAHVLLESRRKGYVTYSFNSNDVQTFYNIDTANLCLKIACTYHKKSLCPNINDVKTVQNYLYSNLNRALEDDQVKSLQCFFSQIYLHAHISLRKNKYDFMVYASVLDKTYRYCYSSLKTDFAEVAAQVMLVLWNISTGCCKSLSLPYRLEKRDCYEAGQNEFYKSLRSNDLWRFESEAITSELRRCFVRTEGCGANLAKLLCTYYPNKMDTVDVGYLENILGMECSAKLQNIDRIKHHSELLFIKNSSYKKEVSIFLEEVADLLSANLDLTRQKCCGDSIFKNIMLLEIMLVAVKHKLDVRMPHQTVEKCLDVVSFILESNFLTGAEYKTTKVLEAFINGITLLIIQSKDDLWNNVNKKKVMDHLIGIIQRSNMKRPVSLSVEVLKHLGAKMDESEPDKVLKMQFLDEILKSLHKAPVKQDMKIRRSPDSRLVIHAMCCSEKHPNRPLLKWALNSLLDLICDPRSSDSSLSSALHSIEILVSDNTLHGSTLPFISQIIVRCVELFKKSSWIVRNADLQLAKALIERFYGVSINGCNRPKNIEDLFVLFPDLSLYFFKVLSVDKLDERAILVFQFFFEGQVREQVLTRDASKAFTGYFMILFTDIIKRYPNNYGKMAVRSYTSLCATREIPQAISDAAEFAKSNVRVLSKNIFANVVFLLRELYDKYTNTCGRNETKGINFAINDLLRFLQKFDSSLFSFLLFRIKPTAATLKEFELLGNSPQCGFEKRLWLHNNVPFLLVNAKPSQICNALLKVLSGTIPSCIQVKVLSILVSRLETNDFNADALTEILKTLFEQSLLTDDSENYLLNCYFKTVLLFYHRIRCANFVRKPYKATSNLYKTMIYVLYFSEQNSFATDIERHSFYALAEAQMLKSVSVSEEVDNDIVSTLIYFKRGAPRQFYFNLFKLVFYYSVRYSTHLEAYNFISTCTNKSYCGMLSALAAFLSVRNLTEHLQDENVVAKFFLDLNLYVNDVPGDFDDLDGYYSVESDNLVPKLFLRRLLRCGASNDNK